MDLVAENVSKDTGVRRKAEVERSYEAQFRADG